MADFKYLNNPVSKKWVISVPRRAARPDFSEKSAKDCPFCSPRIERETILYKLNSVRVITNGFPFAPIHELVIHSEDHTKSFDAFSVAEVASILRVYKHRYNEHSHKGSVNILHNHGKEAGESIPHSHTQIFVLPEKMMHDTPPLSSLDLQNSDYTETTEQFFIAAPERSQLPDEVWIAPKARGKVFGEITDEEIKDFAQILHTIILIFDHRYNRVFSYNFFIYPKEDWYLRLIPRLKTIGGFELMAGVFVNTQLPLETMKFIKSHLHAPDIEKILRQEQAEYHRAV